MMQHWQPRERLDALLDACIDQLDAIPPDRLLLRYPQSAIALGPLLDVAAALAAMSQLSLSPAARQAGREQLRKAVLAQRRRARRPRPPAGVTRAAAWAAALMLVFATGVSGVTVASANTLPHERLYGWKRASEDVWLRVQPSPERAAAVGLGLVDRRIAEAEQVFQRTGQLGAEVVTAIGQAYEQSLELIAATPPDQQQGLLDTLRANSEHHSVDLAALAGQATGEGRAMLSAAVEVTRWARTAHPGDLGRVPQPRTPDSSPAPAPPTGQPPSTPGSAPGTNLPGRAPVIVPPRAQPPAKSRQPGNDSPPPGDDSPPPRDDSSTPGNAPAEPPGQSNRPDEPPGQEKRDRSADATPTPATIPDSSPTAERGRSDSAPGRSDNPPPGQERRAEPDAPPATQPPGPPESAPGNGTDDRGRPEDPGNGRGHGRNKP